MMDLRWKKYKIIEALLAVEEPKVIRDLEEILRIDVEESPQNDSVRESAEENIEKGQVSSLDESKKTNTDWNSEVSEIEKLFLKAGLKDIAEGNTYTNEEVLREINTKYGL